MLFNCDSSPYFLKWNNRWNFHQKLFEIIKKKKNKGSFHSFCLVTQMFIKEIYKLTQIAHFSFLIYNKQWGLCSSETELGLLEYDVFGGHKSHNSCDYPFKACNSVEHRKWGANDNFYVWENIFCETVVLFGLFTNECFWINVEGHFWWMSECLTGVYGNSSWYLRKSNYFCFNAFYQSLE